MSFISSQNSGRRTPFSRHTSFSMLALMAMTSSVFAPQTIAQTIAQTVSEVVITGNPLSRSDSTNNVSSLSGMNLTQQGQSTLGETLNNLPGVSSTYFGPNASRPIVRGLDGDRIRVLSNSGASLDASSLSYDLSLIHI